MSLTTSRREQSLGLPGKCNQCTGTDPSLWGAGSGQRVAGVFNSGCSSEKNLGSSGLPALIPAGGVNLKLVNWYEQSYSVAVVCLLVHKASRAKFLIISAKIHVVHLEACLPIHAC